MNKASFTNPKVRKIASFFGGIALCVFSIGAVVPAFLDPGPPAPVGRALNLAATEAGRTAYVDAMKAQGYEILPSVQISHLQSPVQAQ
jgi:hypothetical protein